MMRSVHAERGGIRREVTGVLRTAYYAVGIAVMVVILLYVLRGEQRRGDRKRMDCKNCAHMFERTAIGRYYCTNRSSLGFLLRPRYCNHFHKRDGGDGDA